MTVNSLTGWTFSDSATLEWQEPFGPGFASKQLAGANGQVMFLIKMDAGFSFPEHGHGGAEFAYLLEGDLVANGMSMKAGHAYGAEAGTTHSEFTTEAGALFIAVGVVPG